MSIILLLEITLLFTVGTWACPKKPPSPCGLCPDIVYGTDICDVGDPECALFPASEVIPTYGTDSDGCRKVEMQCDRGSYIVADDETFRLCSRFKEKGGQIICNQNSTWELRTMKNAYPFTTLYNYNCSSCPDLRQPTAEDCDSATHCVPADIITEQPEDGDDGCTSLSVWCPEAESLGFNTMNYEFVLTDGTRVLDGGDEHGVDCDVQQKLILYERGSKRGAISTMMFIILLLEITLLFSGGTWACPKKTLPSCGLCPDNTFYGTDLCDEGESRCSLIPASEAITYSIGSDGCKEVDMHCPKYSQIIIGLIPVDLFSPFKEAGGGVICNQNSIWNLALGGNTYPLTSLYCYNCSQCLDVRPPSAAECDASTPCLPAIISYEQPEDGCRRIKVECPDRPPGYTTTTYKFFYTNGATEMIPTSLNPQLITLCGVQKAWGLYFGSVLERKGDIDTIACNYT